MPEELLDQPQEGLQVAIYEKIVDAEIVYLRS